MHGHQLIHGNIQILLTQLLPIPAPSSVAPPAARNPAPQIPRSMPLPASLAPLDPSGASLLQASVRVADGAQPELVAQGAAELAALRTALRGVLDLEPVERAALDTRVKV